VILAPAVPDHELHFLTNTKGWKDQDDGHRRSDVAAVLIVSEASAVEGVRRVEAVAATVLDDDAAESYGSTTKNDADSHTSHEEAAAPREAEREGVCSPTPAPSLTTIVSVDVTADVVASSEAKSPTPQLFSDAEANTDRVRSLHSNTGEAMRAGAHSQAPNDDVAAAAAAAASIASAAAEMFRGQLSAITNSQPHCLHYFVIPPALRSKPLTPFLFSLSSGCSRPRWR
jgi:hypothetical protein